jgi:inner membrane protein
VRLTHHALRSTHIDKAGSLITRLPVIGWLTRPASRLAEQTLRHRTGTHSLVITWALSVGAFCLRQVFTPGACGAFLLGYLSHLLADALTISGVSLLWPWRTRAYGVPRALRLRTGGRVEYALTLLIMAAALWGLRHG